MTGTTRIPAAEITGLKGVLVRRLALRTLGQVPSSLGRMWHNPKVLMGMARVGAKVKQCRISRIYAVRNPAKLRRVDVETPIGR